MAHFAFDMPLDDLKTCRFPQTKEPDFDTFWEEVCEDSAAQPLDPQSRPIDYPVPGLVVEEISYAAFDGGRIAGWYLAPSGGGPHPSLAFFHGYSGKRGEVASYLLWALQGFACLAIDVRGQNGQSTDLAEYPGGRAAGWLTSGILDPRKYYFTRAYTDAVRAIDYLWTRPEVDRDRIGATGCSQGGGLSLAVCSLDRRPKLCMAGVPGFCHIGRTLEITRAAPWNELTDFFRSHPEDVDTALRTLSYVELNNLTERITCPSLVSVGLLDELCVPSSVFSAYNGIPVETKHLDIVPYTGHDAGLSTELQIAWARKYLMPPCA